MKIFLYICRRVIFANNLYSYSDFLILLEKSYFQILTLIFYLVLLLFIKFKISVITERKEPSHTVLIIHEKPWRLQEAASAASVTPSMTKQPLQTVAACFLHNKENPWAAPASGSTFPKWHPYIIHPKKSWQVKDLFRNDVLSVLFWKCGFHEWFCKTWDSLKDKNGQSR